MRSSTISLLLIPAASCSSVDPYLVFVFTSAPFSISNRAILFCESECLVKLMANRSGVRPTVISAFRFAPLLTSNSTISIFFLPISFFIIAAINGIGLPDSPPSNSAPLAISSSTISLCSFPIARSKGLVCTSIGLLKGSSAPMGEFFILLSTNFDNAFTLAPSDIRNSAISLCPLPVATCKGVVPEKFVLPVSLENSSSKFGSVPAIKCCLTASMFPSLAAS